MPMRTEVIIRRTDSGHVAVPEREPPEKLVGPLWALGAACVLAMLFLAAWVGAELVLWMIKR